MRPLNDTASVREQYATERNLRARQALYEETTGPHPADVLWEAIASLAPQRVLEVGGGEGWLSQRMQDELQADVTMVDQSERMVELARARGIRAEVGDVQELPFDDGTFDLVVAAWMLYHVADLDRGLAEIARVLAPGGHLVCNTSALHHLAELRDLVGYPWDDRTLTFNAGNAEEILLRHFRTVERTDVEGTATVRDRQRLVDYRDSLMVETRPVPEDVPLPFVVRTGGVMFVAAR
ncbi:MAG TPA: class I SAM-dependent methyltransferase [Gaiellaceae bacterium]